MTIISKLIAFENNSLQAKFAKNLKIDKLTISGSNLPQINPSEVLIINTITFLFEKLYDISTDLNVETKKKISKTTFSIYNCLTTPSITIEDYLKRIQTFMKLNDEFYLLCLIYIDKLSQKTSLLITSLNIHKYS